MSDAFIVASEEPVQVEKLAREVTPVLHGIYCTVGGGEPFVNAIELRRWSEDGKQIVFMLGTCNFDFRDPDETMLVVERRRPAYMREEDLTRLLAEDAAAMAKRPAPAEPCPHCAGTGKRR